MKELEAKELKLSEYSDDKLDLEDIPELSDEQLE